MTNRFDKDMILYRPVGLQELALIYDSGMKAFPARLPQQPIFYPVLQLEYARQTASSWNAKNGQLAGYVTQFKVDDEYIGQFETHTVGKSQYEELWIAAEEMEEFNRHIVGHIKVLEAHFGDAFEGFVPEQFGLKGKNAVEQFTLLANSYLYQRMDFYLEIKRNHKAVFLNYPFWQIYEFKNPGLKEKMLQAIREAWLTSFPKIPLPLPPPSHKDTPPSKQTDAYAQTPRLVDPAEEEITLVEDTDPDEQHWEDPVEEEIAPEDQTNSDAQRSADLVDEETASKKQTVRPLLITRVREEPPPEKKRYAQSLIDPDDEELVSAAEEDSDPPVDFIGREAASRDDTDADASSDLVEEEDLDSLEEFADEEIMPAEQTASPVGIHPARKETKPIEQTQSRPWMNQVQKESTHPRQTASHIARGMELGLSGKYREAIEELSQAVEEDPQHVIAHTSLGVAFHRLGEEERALASYEAALQIDPRYAEAHYFRAGILYRLGNVREAIAGYTRAMGLKPELIEAHQAPPPQDRLTDYSPAPAEMFWIAKPARRILDLNKALETNPRQANLFKERAAAYDRLWNYEQAIADYSSSLRLQPEDASVLHSRGVAYEQIRQYDRALQDYQQAITINPRLSDVFINRGVTLGKMGNLRQAIASLSEGIRLAPQSPDGYFNRGTAYFQQGDFERAIEDFSNVIRLSPRDETAYYWRGISNEEAGRPDQAIADYRQFLQLSQDPRAREDVEQKLSQWNEGKRNGVNNQSVVPEERQNTNQVPSQKSDQDLDLYDLIAVLGERALNSTWLGSGVDCYGESAEELFLFTDHNQPIQGHDLLRITSGIQQTIEGNFVAFDPGSASHWLLIRAWDGSGFYIEINDSKSKDLLMTHFQSFEEVEGASPPYEGLFIRI